MFVHFVWAVSYEIPILKLVDLLVERYNDTNKKGVSLENI